MDQSRSERLDFHAFLDRVKRVFRINRIRKGLMGKDPEPQDPYAYVMAPKKPRHPSRSGAAVAELPDEYPQR